MTALDPTTTLSDALRRAGISQLAPAGGVSQDASALALRLQGQGRIVGCVAVWLPVEHTRSEPIFVKRRIAA
jgi:hypothetical protein